MSAVNNEILINNFTSLPLHAQKEAMNFIAFLQQRYQSPGNSEQAEKPELENEAFVGMWSDRDDLQDSSEWVKSLRNQEWS